MTTRRTPPAARTNIGASVPPSVPLTVSPITIAGERIAQSAPLPPTALPLAQYADEAPGPKVVAEDPLFISRWQNSATVPLSEAPWVTGFRWWVAGVKYPSWGPAQLFRIDCIFKGGHKHGYGDIPRDVWEKFRALTTSVGQFLHEHILGPKGRGCRYRDLGEVN